MYPVTDVTLPADLAKLPSNSKIIQDAAATIIKEATPQPNPTAEALDLGPCLASKRIDANDEAGRPRKRLTEYTDDVNGAQEQFVTMAYHITWTSANSPSATLDS